MLRKIINTFSIVQRSCSTLGKEASAKVGAAKKDVYYGMKKHLQDAESHNKLMSTETSNYEEGLRYLAHMMGEDPENFEVKDVHKAVSYLFPSSLYSRTARPMFLPPYKIIPKQKTLQCSMDGRPFESFYYTRYPSYYNLMHQAAELLYELNRIEDENLRKGVLAPPENETWNETKNGTFWLHRGLIARLTLESISEKQHQHFIVLMERILAHPYSHHAEEFIMKFRSSKPTPITPADLPELCEDSATGKSYAEAYGQRKRAFAEVRVYRPGHGVLSVNGGSFLEAFPVIGDREQVISPLVFTDHLGTVDIELRVSGNGLSSQAGAARLAIARALTCFLEEEDILRLRLAGYLTMDMRFKEKKKSGMPKARRIYIWKRR